MHFSSIVLRKGSAAFTKIKLSLSAHMVTTKKKVLNITRLEKTPALLVGVLLQSKREVTFCYLNCNEIQIFS